MSMRLASWNYKANGAYFVTICTHLRQPTLGEVVNGGFHPSPLGTVVRQELLQLQRDRQGVHLESSVLMPEHVHFLVSYAGETERPELGVIVSGLKAGVTRVARGTAIIPPRSRVWQRGFYDRVVRNDAELLAIREYIATNPLRFDLQVRGCVP